LLVKYLCANPFARVPSKSKLLASEFPNMETCSSIERHNDDIKAHVLCGSDVRNLTLTQRSAFDLAAVKWPSERVTVPKKRGRFEDPGTPHRLGTPSSSKRRPHDAHCALPKRKYVSNLDLDGTGVTRFAAHKLLIILSCHR